MSTRSKRTTAFKGSYNEQNDQLSNDKIKHLRYLKDKDRSDKKCEVGIGKSLLPTCNGEGLFATKKFRVNQFICFYDGVRVKTREEMVAMDDSHEYLWSEGDGDDFICINAQNPDSGYGRYANDSLTPQHLQAVDKVTDNAKIMYNPSLDRSKPVILRALREILPGEEIYVAYGGDYWSVYRGLDYETALRVMECYDLPNIPPHRPDMVVDVEYRDVEGKCEQPTDEEVSSMKDDSGFAQIYYHEGYEETKENDIPADGRLNIQGPITIYGIGDVYPDGDVEYDNSQCNEDDEVGNSIDTSLSNPQEDVDIVHNSNDYLEVFTGGSG